MHRFGFNIINAQIYQTYQKHLGTIESLNKKTEFQNQNFVPFDDQKPIFSNFEVGLNLSAECVVNNNFFEQHDYIEECG